MSTIEVNEEAMYKIFKKTQLLIQSLIGRLSVVISITNYRLSKKDIP